MEAEPSRLQRNFFRQDYFRVPEFGNRINKIFLYSLHPEHPARPLPSSGFRIPEFRRIGNSPCGLAWRAGLSLAQTWVKEFVD